MVAESITTPTDAYSLLTNIQGFDSFSLGPASTQEEIVRAFETQKLIWHPDRNPGDVQAAKVYQRMLAAYNALMDPEKRRKIDSGLQTVPQAVQQSASSGTPSALRDDALDASAADGASGASLSNGASADDDGVGVGGYDAVAESPQQQQQQHGRVYSALEASSMRLPMEDLGAPPPTARPFAYIDTTPGSSTPAGKAGLSRGDALLRIGDAAHLREVQSQLQASLHSPLPVLVIDVQGKFLKKWVVPHAWDPFAPSSFLGCQMSDQCPLDLVATHPALELHISKRRSSSLRSFEGKGGEEESEDDEGGGHGHGNGTKASGPAAALRSATDAAARNVSSGPLWARILLFLASFTGIFLGATIAIYPAMSYRIFSIWDLATVECRDVIDYITVAAVPPVAPPPAPPARSLLAASSTARVLLQQAEERPRRWQQQQQQRQQRQQAYEQPQRVEWGHSEDGDLAAGPTRDDVWGGARERRSIRRSLADEATAPSHAPAPPRMNLAPPPKPPAASPPPTKAWTMRFAPPRPPPSPPPPEQATVRAPPVTNPHHAQSGGGVIGGVSSVLGPVQQSSAGAPGGGGGSGGAPMGAFVKQIVATSLGLDVVRNSVTYLLYASLDIVGISTLGCLLACCPPAAPRTRAVLTFLFLTFGLPSWVFLVFASVSALALRDEAEDLVRRYWLCLRTIAPGGADGANASMPSSAYTHADAAASICIASASLLLVSLLMACRAVGWRSLARHSIMCISMVSGLMGAATLAVGLVLKSTTNIDHPFFDGSVMGLGGAVFFASLVGMLGAKLESTALLRGYAGALAALLLALFGIVTYLLTSGTEAVKAWLDSNWTPIEQHVCTSAISLCYAGMMSKDEFEMATSTHLLAITTLLALLFLVLLVDLAMACVLQCLVARHGPGGGDAEMEMESLVAEDDEREEGEEDDEDEENSDDEERGR